jgi:uncharacterized delta-60 repeat protein
MRKLYAFLFTIIVSGSLHAQVNVQWESRFTGPGNNTDQAIDMAVDAAGNVYVTGTSYSGAAQGYNIVTVKYDNAGAQQWTATYNGAANLLDQANALTLDASGNVYVAGFTYVSGSNADMVIIKYNSAGAQQWAVTHNYQGYFDQARDIAVASSGNVYVTGSGQYNSSGTDTDMLTVKYNSAGAFQWDEFFSTDVSSPSELDEAFRIVLDGSENVHITGVSAGVTATNNLDYLTIKYNSAGTQQWRMRYNYNGNFDTPTDIALDGSGNVYVTGTGYFNALQDANYLTVKYNSSGAQQWVRTYNGEGSDYDKATSMVLDATGNVYITGRSVGATSAEDVYTMSYDPSGNVLWADRYTTSGSYYEEGTDIDISGTDLFVTGYSYDPASNNDFLTIRFTAATGAIQWSTRFNGPSNNTDRAFAIDLDGAGNIYVSGQSNGTGTGADYSTIKYCQLTTSAGPDAGICVGDGTPLTATSSGGSNFVWTVVSGDPISVPGNFSCNPCASPTASPAVTTVYAVSSTSGTGCVDYDTVEVVVNPLPGPVIQSSGPVTFCDGDSVYLFTDPNQTGYTWSTGSTNDSILVTTTGTYQVTVIDAMGCANSTSQGVLVNSLPNIDAGLQDSVCAGGSAQLQAANGSSYLWDTDTELSAQNIANPVATPTSSSWYYVTGTDGNGCQNRDSVFIVVLPLPTAPTIIRLDPNLISSVSTGNQWYMDGMAITGATGQTYTFTSNGDYHIVYTDQYGCQSVSDTLSIIDLSTGEYVLGNVHLYPVPVAGDGVVYMESDLAVDMITVFDAAGKRVIEQGVASQLRSVIQFGTLPAGMYSVVVQFNNGTASTFRVVR